MRVTQTYDEATERARAAERRDTVRRAKGRRKLILAAERIRPDVVVFGCMEAGGSLDRVAAEIRAALPSGVALEVLTFDPNELERMPWL